MKNTNKVDLKNILDKFYKGETTLEEEKELAGGGEMPEAGKDLFRFFEYERKAAPPSFPMEKLEGRPRFLFFTKVAASSSLLFLLGYLLYSYLSNEPIPVKWIQVTTNADRQELSLPDGSAVTLNSNSSLKYAESFAERLVYLEGEAYFEIKRDEAHAFRVISGKATTEVLGTAFNLSRKPGSATVELEVSEGKVAFSSFDKDLNERIFVSAGERAVYFEASNTIRKFDSFDPNLIAWKTRRLVFEDITLQKLLEDAAGYFDVEFKADSGMLSKCRFSGTFDNPTLEDVLDALRYVLDIRYERQGKIIILKGGGC